jgi:hypothetical protein
MTTLELETIVSEASAWRSSLDISENALPPARDGGMLEAGLRYPMRFTLALIRCVLLLAALIAVLGNRAAEADDSANPCGDISRQVEIAVAEVSARTNNAETALIELYDCVKRDGHGSKKRSLTTAEAKKLFSVMPRGDGLSSYEDMLQSGIFMIITTIGRRAIEFTPSLYDIYKFVFCSETLIEIVSKDGIIRTYDKKTGEIDFASTFAPPLMAPPELAREARKGPIVMSGSITMLKALKKVDPHLKEITECK